MRSSFFGHLQKFSLPSCSKTFFVRRVASVSFVNISNGACPSRSTMSQLDDEHVPFLDNVRIVRQSPYRSTTNILVRRFAGVRRFGADTRVLDSTSLCSMECVESRLHGTSMNPFTAMGFEMSTRCVSGIAPGVGLFHCNLGCVEI